MPTQGYWWAGLLGEIGMFLADAGWIDVLFIGWLLLAGFGRLRPKPKDTHGSAAWANLIDLRRAGMLRPKGLLLGDYAGAPVYYDDDAPMLLVSPARSGKGITFILPNALGYGLEK